MFYRMKSTSQSTLPRRVFSLDLNSFDWSEKSYSLDVVQQSPFKVVWKKQKEETKKKQKKQKIDMECIEKLCRFCCTRVE